MQTRWVLRLMRMCVWNSMRAWISYRSFLQKWNFISGDKIRCKHYPKWNAYTCQSKYWIFLKCSQNKTSCEQNLLSCQFEISNRFEFISPPMWTYSEFHPARSHVNADNEITSQRSEILSWSKMLKFLRFFTCVSWGILSAQILLIVQTTVIRHSVFHFSSFSIFLQSRISKSVISCDLFCSLSFPFYSCLLFFLFPVLFSPSLYSLYFLISLIVFFSNLLSFLFSFPITRFCLLFPGTLLLFHLFSFY